MITIKLKNIIKLLLISGLIWACDTEIPTPTITQKGATAYIEGTKAGSISNYLEQTTINFYTDIDKVVFTGNYNGKDILACAQLAANKGNVKVLDFSQAHFLEDAFPERAFSGVTLRKIIFPKELRNTGNLLFSKSIKVDTIVLPPQLKVIGKGAFNMSQNTNTFFGDIPQTVRKIELQAFVSYKGETVLLPKELEYIGRQAFAFSNITHQEIPYKLKVLTSGIFYRCLKLKDVVLPKDMVRIDTLAFTDCASLKNTNFLPDNIKVIGPQAFAGCKMKHLHLPPQLERLEDGALMKIADLEELVIPDKVNYIGDYCFKGRYVSKNKDGNYEYLAEYDYGTGGGSTPIKKIYIPKSVTHIGQFAFTNLLYLEELHLKWNTPIPYNACAETLILPSDRFIGLDKDKVILYVPVGATAAYRAAKGWKDFKHIVEE